MGNEKSGAPSEPATPTNESDEAGGSVPPIAEEEQQAPPNAIRFEVTAEEAGTRVDKLIVKHLSGMGRTGVRRLFEKDRVFAIHPGGKRRRVQKGDAASEGQILEVAVESEGQAALADENAPLQVVLEMERALVLEKPAGQPTAPINPGERGSLANALVARYPECAPIGFSPREPGLVHRLDTDTSGLILAARTEEAFEALTKGLREGRLDKRYLLLCSSKDLPESGTIDIPLAPHPKDRKRVLACIHERDVARNNPRPASTSYRVISVEGKVALVEASAARALRHQIRAHFAAIEHPLYGDALYGGSSLDGLGRHALHAHRITWPGDAVVPAFTATSPLPPELERHTRPAAQPAEGSPSAESAETAPE